MAQIATGLSRLIARRNKHGEWEVARPDEGPGIVCSYGALWRAAGIGFVVLK